MKRVLTLVASAAMLLSLCAFGGCSTNGPKNASQTAYTAKTIYTNAAETGAVYGELTQCSADRPDIKVCAQPAVVNKIKLSKDVAKPAIDAAEAAVRDPSFPKSTADALNVSAYQAALALAAIVDPLTELTHTKKAAP